MDMNIASLECMMYKRFNDGVASRNAKMLCKEGFDILDALADDDCMNAAGFRLFMRLLSIIVIINGYELDESTELHMERLRSCSLCCLDPEDIDMNRSCMLSTIDHFREVFCEYRYKVNKETKEGSSGSQK